MKTLRAVMLAAVGATTIGATGALYHDLETTGINKIEIVTPDVPSSAVPGTEAPVVTTTTVVDTSVPDTTADITK